MLHRTVLRLALCLLVFVAVGAQEEASSTEETPAEPVPVKKPEVEDKFDAEGHTDWGSYYDPQNIFCGKYDCYKILGFDYGEWATDRRPTTKQITKRYRALSRAWHPDKSKHKDAKERFVKIARAYEVLTDFEQRKEYDMMRFNQEAYYNKYGSGVIFTYAPKSDATIIIIFVLILMNLYTWFAQKHRWQNVADRLTKAAVEDWSPSMGGTPESKQLRMDALDILKEQEAANATTTETVVEVEKKGKAKKVKISAKEKKLIEQEAILPVIAEMVEQIDDFGAGFHKPTVADLFIVTVAKFPVKFASGLAWQTKYAYRRLMKEELNEEERAVLTERVVGHVNWELATEDDRTAMIKLELWKKDNFSEWVEEQEFKKLSKAEQKMYKRMKKSGKEE